MKKLISCEFNMDTACVELRYPDGMMISIDCTEVEYEVAHTITSETRDRWVQICISLSRVFP